MEGREYCELDISVPLCFAFLKINDVEVFLLMPCFLNALVLPVIPFLLVCKPAKFFISASVVINVSISICKPVKFYPSFLLSSPFANLNMFFHDRKKMPC